MFLLVYVLKIGVFCFMDPGPHPSTKAELLGSVWSRCARPRSCAEVFLTLMRKTGVESQHEIMKTIFDLKKQPCFTSSDIAVSFLFLLLFQRNCHKRHSCLRLRVKKQRNFNMVFFLLSLKLGLYEYY